MKKLIPFLFFALISATRPAEKIEGIGVFKIGQPIEFLDQFANENNAKIAIVDSYKEEANFGGKSKIAIAELVKNKNNKYDSPIEAPKCSLVRVFKISHYSVSGISFEKFTVSYYNDKLYEIETDYSDELRDALTVKYGEGKPSSRSKEVNCIYNLTGNKITKKEFSQTDTWNNGTINCYATISKYYSDKCEERFLSYITVIDTIISKKSTDCFLKESKEESKSKMPKKESLNDL